MRIANLAGRAHLVAGDLALDIAEASGGRFGPSPESVYEAWSEFREWADDVSVIEHPAARPFAVVDLDAVVTRPRQIFAIGLNYADHAAEANLAVPENPIVFTKFASSLTGADAEIALPADTVDWEAELVAVVGTGGRDISEADAWSRLAGLAVGQDLSERTIQWWGPPAQFSLGKSLAGFAPVGPWIVTVDEISKGHNRDDLGVICTVTEPDGSVRVLQSGRTRNLIFSVPRLIARLSALVELLPGDLIFTGTPAGVGMGLDPAVYLKEGQTLTTEIEGIGRITQRFVSA
jgi:2-keto-4-pentenoate hydratase/2-oxohepta-3-ene-1,7-dioic acid hydratase in catechol pathway